MAWYYLFDRIMAQTNAPAVILAHITTVDAQTFYLSSAPYVSGTVADGETAPASTAYNPIITGAPRVRMGVDDLFSGTASTTWGDLTLATNENALAMFGLPGASIEVYVAIPPEYRTPDNFTIYQYPSIPYWGSLILKGKVANFSDNTDGTMRVTIQGQARTIFERPLASVLFDATNTPTIPTENIGKPIPRLIGKCRHIDPVLIDAATLTYQYNDNSTNVTLFRAYDGGLDLVLTTSTDYYTSTTMQISGSYPDGHFAGCRLRVLSGTGAGQLRYISTFVSGTATVATWTTIPDGTSIVEIELWTQPAAHKITTLTVPQFGLTVDAERTYSYSVITHIATTDLGFALANVGDYGMAGLTGIGVYIKDATTIGAVFTELCRGQFCAWGTVPTYQSFVAEDFLLVQKIDRTFSSAVATIDASTLFRCEARNSEDIVWRATGRDKRTWSVPATLAGALPAATAEWIKAGGINVAAEDLTAKTYYGAREYIFEGYSYEPKPAPGTDSVAEVVAKRIKTFSGQIRRRFSVTVPAIFAPPLLFDFVTFTPPDSQYGGAANYRILAWTFYTDANGVCLMDLELMT